MPIAISSLSDRRDPIALPVTLAAWLDRSSLDRAGIFVNLKVTSDREITPLQNNRFDGLRSDRESLIDRDSGG
jgi:hypothetical protein